MNILTLTIVGYLTILASLVLQIFRPPSCTGNSCILPMFQPKELKHTDFYFFVTDDPGLASFGSHKHGKPPAQIARLGARLLAAEAELDRARHTATAEGVGFSEDEVDAQRGETARAVVLDSPLKLVTRVRGLDLSGGSLGELAGGKNWEERLRVPVFASTRANATLYGLFFLCPAGRPLDPAEYPLRVADQGDGSKLDEGGGVPRTLAFEEAVLFTSSPLTRHLAPQKRQAASMLLNKAPATADKASPAQATTARSVTDARGGATATANHWLFSGHPLRLRLASPRQGLQAAFLAPDGLPLRLHRASGEWWGAQDEKDNSGGGLFFNTKNRGNAEGGNGDGDVGGGAKDGKQVSPLTRGRGGRWVMPGPMLHRPWFYVDDFTILTSRHVLELSANLSYPDPPALVQVRPCSLGRMRVFRQVEAAFAVLSETGLVSVGDLDELKRYLSDEWLWRFGLMQLISVAHAVLSFLAFKHEVGFWKGRESVAGLSSRTVAFNSFASTVIFLYLADYSTSFVLLATTFASCVVDAWKVTKVFKLSFGGGFAKGGKWFTVGAKSSAEKRTAALDATAMDMVSLAVWPLVVGFALYSLVTNAHKSWYSWVIESLANGIYVFGFVFMTPQLFINYKLKSVAHLPWRVMVYKFFNTFIDDVFSFLVDMPWSHRLACFRDDFIFFVFLYQLWLYPTDKTRANEYGIAYDDGDDSNKIASAGAFAEASERKQPPPPPSPSTSVSTLSENTAPTHIPEEEGKGNLGEEGVLPSGSEVPAAPTHIPEGS